VYYIVACNKDDTDESHVEQIISQNVLKENNKTFGEMYPLSNKSVDKTQFKVGSLDQLMELMDTFNKYDQTLDQSCKKNEKMYFEMAKELNKPGAL